MLTALLAVTMLPAAGLQAASAYADEPAAQRPQTSGGDMALEGSSGAELPEGEVAEGAGFAFDGFAYRVEGGNAVLVGFEDGAALEGAVTVPERVSDGVGSATVAAVEIAEGQVAEGVTSLTLPQAVERVETRGLAAALPSLASIEVSGSEGAYSSAAGMLFRQERGEASSDGSTTLMANAELVWAPPAMVVARIPIECKAVAAGAFADADALETVMAFGVMESIAEGAFAEGQVNRVTIVVPITNYASAAEGSERVSGSVQLSEGIPTSDKKRPWFDFGFDSDHIVSGAPFGEIDGVVAVSDEGVAEDRSLVTPLENGRSHLDLTPEEQAEKDARRGVDPDCGLSFSYQASMDLSVKWFGDVTATPAHLEIPAYATIDGVKYQVTSIEPNAFAGAVFLESLVIPEGITTIGESAFAGCANLREVSLPSTLRTIDYAAFEGTALESVTIPENTAYIGGEAFADSALLKDAIILGAPAISATSFLGTQVTLESNSLMTRDGREAEFVASSIEPTQNIEDNAPYEESGSRADNVAAYNTTVDVQLPSDSSMYTSIPTGEPLLSWYKCSFIVSPYYDVYYGDWATSFTEAKYVHYSIGSFINNPTLVEGSDLIVDWGYSSDCNHILRYDDFQGKRAIYGHFCCYTPGGGSTYAHNGFAFAFVPKDGYQLNGLYRYRPAGSLTGENYQEQDGNLLEGGAHPFRVGGGYLYASFGNAEHSLTVEGSHSDSVVVTPLGGGTWNGSSATVDDRFAISLSKPGYTLKSVSVSGDGTTYDEATKTLKMGWEDATVSVEVVPNDIDIQVVLGQHGASASVSDEGKAYAGNVEFGEQQQSDELGAYYDMTIGTEATKDNPGFDSSTSEAMANKSTVSVVSTGSGANKRSVVQFKTSEADGRQVGCELSVTSKNGWAQDYWKLVNLDTGAEVVLGSTGVNIDYAHKWRLVHEFSGLDYGIEYDRNNSDVWTGPDTNSGSYNTASGFNNLPVPVRNGFWFAGWRWQNEGDMGAEGDSGNGANAWWNGTDDADARQFGIPAGAYGRAKLVATWTPKVYRIDYDVSATTITEGDATHNMATEPASSYYIHPQARPVIATGSGNAWEPLSWDGASDDEKSRIREVDLTFLDKDGVEQAITNTQLDYTLAESTLEGFKYEGWTTSKISPGTSPSDSSLAGPWKHVFNDGTQDLNNESIIFGSYWTTAQTMPDGGYDENNAKTLYGVWSRVGEVTVTLGAAQPYEAAAGGTVNDGESVTGGMTGTERAIQYWQNRGLFVYGELLPAANPDHTTQTVFDQEALAAAIEAGEDVKLVENKLQFSDLKRVGFRFLGWGTRDANGAPAKVYLRYLESPDGDTGAGFYLTPEGMSHVLAWEEMAPTNTAGELAETWEALWEIRTYEITLHVPAATVKNTNGNGWSEAAYRWEQDGTTSGSSDALTTVSSWRKATKEWKYWDAFYVPYYDLNSPFNAYRGWFRGSIGANGQFEFTDNDTFENDGQTYRKPVITEAQGRAQGQAATDDNTFRVTAANLDPKKLWQGGQPGQESDLDNVAAPDGSIELWLYTEPVFINVTAPMGVFLANDEPYVVGSDPRMALEEEAKFTVKESNQDLVLTSITATDIVEADVNQTTNQVDVKTTTDDTRTTEGNAISRASGMCYQMFDIKNDKADTSSDPTGWNQDNARIFWVSPEETVNPYVKETNQDPGQHDMGSRVYFGFGGGKGSSNHLGDNVVEDDPDTSTDGDYLADFELKQNYAAGGLAGKDGYKVATDAEGTSYVYDSAKDQYGRTTGTGEDAHTVWYTYAAKPGDANGRLILTEVGSGTGDQPARTVDVSRPLVWRDYSFYYGLDLDKCSFNLGAIQSMVEAESAWNYNVGYKRPLLKLMFTFAVERVPSVSYGAVGLSSYASDDPAALNVRQGTEGADIDAEAIVSVGPATDL